VIIPQSFSEGTLMKNGLCAIALTLSLINGCSKQPPVPGFVGKPLELIPTLKAPEDTAGCTFKWSFTSKPAESNLDVLSFQPDSRSFSVTIVPDAMGAFEVQFVATSAENKDVVKQIFKCDIQGADQAPPDSSSGVITEAAAPLPQYAKPGTVAQPPVPVYAPPPSLKPKAVTRAVVRGRKIPKVAGKYTIQLSSWKKYNQAEDALKKLVDAEIDAYIQKAFFQETKETFYRVRTGTFDSYEEAKTALNAIQKKVPHEKPWIDFVREDQ